MSAAENRPAKCMKAADRIAGLASGVREEYARPWHDLSPRELADCFITAMRSDGWLSRAEIAAREAAAWCAGRDAAFAAGLTVDAGSIGWDASHREDAAVQTKDEMLTRIRALTPPAAAQAALDAVVREAVEKEREACAQLLESGGNHGGLTIMNGVWIERRAAFHCAVAIRARGEAE